MEDVTVVVSVHWKIKNLLYWDMICATEAEITLPDQFYKHLFGMSCRQTESGSGLDDGSCREAHNHNTNVPL